jgi:hypothetical protein
MGSEQAAERAWGKRCGVVWKYRGFGAGSKGDDGLETLKFFRRV